MSDLAKRPWLELLQKMQELGHLKGISALLHWDQSTYMPTGAYQSRASQAALIKKIIHEKETSPDFDFLLSQLVNLKTGEINKAEIKNFKEQRAIEEIYKDWKKSKVLPPSFIEEMAFEETKGMAAWEEARNKNDFKLFAPSLEKLIKLQKTKADYLKSLPHHHYETRYDALLDLYSPGMKQRELDQLFSDLKDKTIQLLKKIQRSPNYQNFSSVLAGKTFDVSKQWDFSLKILQDMGLDFNFSRQDKSTHPFSTNFHPQDVRVTTCLNEHDLMDGLGSCVHEGGHALYELGMDADWFGTPLAEAISMDVHESQSRLWENLVGKSMVFWHHYLPQLKSIFPEELGNIELGPFYKSINQIKPHLIRVESDELTYNLHIIIRYEMEKLMINEEVSVYELPRLWNEKYQNYLGLTPANDVEGIMQDIHWSSGSIGYFPSYSLGNLMSVQFYEKAKQCIDGLEHKMKHGDFKDLREWLRINIHQKGRLCTSQELLLEVTGRPLSLDDFFNYMEKKYLALYP